jgi:ubiquilin
MEQMGPPPNPEELDRMLDNPNFLSQMNEMMNNPAFLEMMEQSPMLRDNPIARQMFRDPAYRRMILDPNIIRAQARAQRGLARGPTFPAPGVTDTTPQGAEGTQNTAAQGANATGNALPSQPPLAGMFGPGAAANPFAALFGPGATGTQNPAGATDSNANSSATPANPFGNLFGAQPSPEFMRAMMQGMGGGAPPADGATPSAASGDADQMAAVTRLMSNPDFMRAMGNAMGGGAGGAAGTDGGLGALLSGLGGGGFGASPPPPADTRPPEERYADQLQQLNDMGFYEFERNVQALRRSGGSVQGAVEYLLSNPGS